MGLLKVGKPLGWKETARHSAYVRLHGVRQFIRTYHREKNASGDPLRYGDEVEHALLKLDARRRRTRLSLRGTKALERLRERERERRLRPGSSGQGVVWHQEYGSWMIESTPGAPYEGDVGSLLRVEQNMRLRRARLQASLAPDEIAPTMVNFPLMGTADFVHPPAAPGGDVSHSDGVPDECINPHPRFGTLTANIRERRGSKVDIRVPLFRDVATPEFLSAGASGDAREPGKTPCIEMDCMAYGMGMCCLQVTFQASDMDESRLLHDQFTVLAPLMLALTAATPIFRGRLAATDARWDALAASVDDRRPDERGQGTSEPEPGLAGNGVRPLSKSRYGSISAYIHGSAHATPEASAFFNDVPCEVDEELMALMEAEGIDRPVARHMAHLFARDPLVAFEGAVEEVDDDCSTEHFDSINSTNWQTARWKPPPLRESGAPYIGWRTEFRSMEVQPTDFENAAFTAFVVLVTRALLAFDVTLLAPLSMVDENMQRAHTADAVNAQKFWFRSRLLGDEGEECPEDRFEEMTMDQIMNGREGRFLGLVPLCHAYVEHIGCSAASSRRLRQYLDLVSDRASGALLTPASWMRGFVVTHPLYRRDSVVSPEIAYDLVGALSDIGLGQRPCPELLGFVKAEELQMARQGEEHDATPLDASRAGAAELRALLRGLPCLERAAAEVPSSERPRLPAYMHTYIHARLALRARD